MIDVYVNDIQNSLENGCYFSALSLALTLPDICGMAEYSDSTNVADRYINWYDQYLGEYMRQGKERNEGSNPWLSGEIVYNLRNTFLYQGSPNVIGSKVKNENNQIDKFMLILGKGTLSEITLSVDIGHGKMKYKAISVDVTYLCNCICDCALWYFEKNIDKFHFDFLAVTEDSILNPSEDSPPLMPLNDIINGLVNEKAKSQGSTLRFSTANDKEQIRTMSSQMEIKSVTEMLDLADYEKNDKVDAEKVKQKSDGAVSSEKNESAGGKKPIKNKTGDTDIKATKHSKKSDDDDSKEKSKSSKKSKVGKDDSKTSSKKKKQTEKERREAQIRSFYGQHFKKQIYKDKKEQIIQIILKAKTRQQVNNGLTKLFRSEEAGIVFKRIQPLIKDLPGK